MWRSSTGFGQHHTGGAASGSKSRESESRSFAAPSLSAVTQGFSDSSTRLAGSAGDPENKDHGETQGAGERREEMDLFSREAKKLRH